MFVITVINGGQKYWLKGTTWTFSEERADKFETVDDVMAAAKKAERFMHKSIRRKYLVEDLS